MSNLGYQAWNRFDSFCCTGWSFLVDFSQPYLRDALWWHIAVRWWKLETWLYELIVSMFKLSFFIISFLLPAKILSCKSCGRWLLENFPGPFWLKNYFELMLIRSGFWIFSIDQQAISDQWYCGVQLGYHWGQKYWPCFRFYSRECAVWIQSAHYYFQSFKRWSVLVPLNPWIAFLLLLWFIIHS